MEMPNISKRAAEVQLSREGREHHVPWPPTARGGENIVHKTKSQIQQCPRGGTLHVTWQSKKLREKVAYLT